MHHRRIAAAVLAATATIAACSPEKRTFNNADGGGGGGGSDAPGGGGACTPGTERPCYSGPEETEGFGACKAGIARCADDGKGVGACSGEVLPEPEDCATPADTDCRPDCGELQWFRHFGDVGDDYGTELAVDPAGNVFLAGTFTGRIDLGGGPLSADASVDEYDNFLVRFDAAGNHVWSLQTKPVSMSYLTTVVPTPDGGLVVAGDFAGAFDLGGGSLPRGMGSTAFVAKLDAAGRHVWSRSFPGRGTSSINGAAIDSAGNVIAVGKFTSVLEPIVGPQLASAGEVDVLFVKMTASGMPTFSARFGGAGSDVAARVAVDAKGKSFVTGQFAGTMTAGDIPLVSAGEQDAFVLVIDALGGVVWSRRGGGPGYDSGQDIAVDAEGNAYLGANVEPGADFSGAELEVRGRSDALLARFDPRGNLLWRQTFGDSGIDSVNQVLLDARGTLWLTGTFAGTVNFGGAPLVARGAQTPYRARFDALGAHLFSDAALSQGAAVDALGNTVEAAGFTGVLDVRGETATSVGGEDVFVVKLATPDNLTPQ